MDNFSLIGDFLRQLLVSLATKEHEEICFPIELSRKLEELKKNGRRLNFEKRKTVIFMIFSAPYWVSGTKGCIAKTLYDATKYDIKIRSGVFGFYPLRYSVASPHKAQCGQISAAAYTHI